MSLRPLLARDLPTRPGIPVLIFLGLSCCTSGWTKSGEDQAALNRDTAYCRAVVQEGLGPPTTNVLALPTTVTHDGLVFPSLDPGMDECLRDEGWRGGN